MRANVPAIDGGQPVRDDILGYGGQSISDAEKDAVVEALEGDYITRGPTVDRFEERVADFVGVDHAIATTSGTTALHLCGRAAGFNEDDEVITTPLTFASTAHVASYTGADPVFADVKRSTYNLDPNAVRDQVTEDTEALVPMHYAGNPCEIDPLLEVADDYELTVIWDACHAFGGSVDSTAVGSHRDMAVFSFHPVKNITTGEGGMVVTDDDHLAERLQSLRSFEMNHQPGGHEDEPWYQVTEGLGYNFNVTDMQAALGLAQLDRLESFKQRRNEIIARYDDAFETVPGIETPTVRDGVDPMFHLYVVEVHETQFGCDRRTFVEAMHEENIGVQVHYVPLHHHPYFQQEFGYETDDYPVANEVYEHVVSLPLFPEMSKEDVNDVLRAVKRLHDYHT